METKLVNYNVIKIMNNRPDYLSIGLKHYFYTNFINTEINYYMYLNVQKKDLTEDITEEMIKKLADEDLSRFNSLINKSSEFLDNYYDTEEKKQRILDLQNEINFNEKIFTFLGNYELIPCSEEQYNLCCYKLEKEIKNQFSFSC
jgi:hypothetical protein